MHMSCYIIIVWCHGFNIGMEKNDVAVVDGRITNKPKKKKSRIANNPADEKIEKNDEWLK